MVVRVSASRSCCSAGGSALRGYRTATEPTWVPSTTTGTVTGSPYAAATPAAAPGAIIPWPMPRPGPRPTVVTTEPAVSLTSTRAPPLRAIRRAARRSAELQPAAAW